MFICIFICIYIYIYIIFDIHIHTYMCIDMPIYQRTQVGSLFITTEICSFRNDLLEFTELARATGEEVRRRGKALPDFVCTWEGGGEERVAQTPPHFDGDVLSNSTTFEENH